MVLQLNADKTQLSLLVKDSSEGRTFQKAAPSVKPNETLESLIGTWYGEQGEGWDATTVMLEISAGSTADSLKIKVTIDDDPEGPIKFSYDSQTNTLTGALYGGMFPCTITINDNDTLSMTNPYGGDDIVISRYEG